MDSSSASDATPTFVNPGNKMLPDCLQSNQLQKCQIIEAHFCDKVNNYFQCLVPDYPVSTIQ